MPFSTPKRHYPAAPHDSGTVRLRQRTPGQYAAIEAIPEVDLETFVPRGSTALLDAIGRAIAETGEALSKLPEADRPGTVIFVTLTDGEENSSLHFDMATINQQISHQRSVYQWQFCFPRSPIRMRLPRQRTWGSAPARHSVLPALPKSSRYF